MPRTASGGSISGRTLARVNRLILERDNCITYMRNIETEYNVLTDQYMNGTITWDIGKDQARLMREHNRLKRRLNNIEKDLNKVRLRYNLPL